MTRREWRGRRITKRTIGARSGGWWDFGDEEDVDDGMKNIRCLLQPEQHEWRGRCRPGEVHVPSALDVRAKTGFYRQLPSRRARCQNHVLPSSAIHVLVNQATVNKSSIAEKSASNSSHSAYMEWPNHLESSIHIHSIGIFTAWPVLCIL